MDQSIIEAIRATALSQWIRDTWWSFAACETLHFVGLCIFLGAMLIVDLRLIGVLKSGRMTDALRFIHLAIAGFLINLVTGTLMFISNPDNYWSNPMFKLKVALVLIAGLNVIYFETVERKKLQSLPGDAVAHDSVKPVAILSLVLWFSIIVVGRLLPVTGIG